MHREIFKNTAFQILARGITALVGFIITILVARHFGAYDFGEFSKITSYVAIFYLFTDLGLNAIFLKNSKSFSSLFYLRIFISAGIFAIANLMLLVFPYNPNLDIGFSPFVRLGIFIFSLTIFSQSIIFSATSIFQKKLRFDLFAIAQIIGEFFNLLLISVLIFFGKSLELVLISFVVSSFITATASLFLAREGLSTFDSQYAKKIFVLSLPIGLMLIFNLIYFRIDVVLLSIFKSNEDVAYYALSYRFFDFFIAVPLFLSNSIYPKLIESLKDKEKFTSITKNYFLIYLVSSILIIIPVWFLSPLFGLIGKTYLPAVVPFRILILSLPVFFLTSFLQWILITLDRQKFLMVTYFIAGFINVALNFIFIPRYSYFASAIITVIGETGVMIALFYMLKKEWGNFNYGEKT